MLTLFVKDQNVKHFMNALFYGAMFDAYEVRSAYINHFIKLEINGELLHKKNESPNNYITWSELKQYLINFIKGNIKPSYIKIIFSIQREALNNILTNTAAAFINLEYANNKVRFLTATSQREFSLSKEQDKIWDDHVRRFFYANGIMTEEET